MASYPGHTIILVSEHWAVTLQAFPRREAHGHREEVMFTKEVALGGVVGTNRSSACRAAG